MTFKVISNVLFQPTLLLTLFFTATSAYWSCSEVGTAHSIVPRLVKGVWYEVAHIPSNKEPSCIKVTVPESQVKGNYTLKLSYIKNIESGSHRIAESLVFPWSEAQNGNFSTQYSDKFKNVLIKYKFLGGFENDTLVCGYSDLLPDILIIRFLSRTQQVSNNMKKIINTLAKHSNIDVTDITWVQQDESCNGSDNLPIFSAGLLIILYVFQTILNNSLWA